MTALEGNNQSAPAVLTASRLVLHFLIILNWFYGAAILILLFASLVSGDQIMSALDAPEPLFRGMQAVALLGLFTIPLHYIILRRLLEMVESVRAHQPFIGQNAIRLQTIAWALLAMQCLSVVIGGIAKAVSTPKYPFNVDAGFSTSGWLAVILLFVLARVFGEGARMQEELEGTV